MAFTDTEFMSAQEKEKVLKHWKRFIKSRFARGSFTKALYKHLTLHCSFIAHYNIDCFHDHYFTEPKQTLRFLSQFDPDYNFRSVEYGSDYWLFDPEYIDLNSAMCEALLPYRRTLYQELLLKHRYRIQESIAKAKQALDQHISVESLLGPRPTRAASPSKLPLRQQKPGAAWSSSLIS